jgi:aminoglycoside phosphotransferase (APT) family kinase protein
VNRLLELIAPERRAAAGEALRAAGLAAATDPRVLSGGVSGAAIWRFEAAGRDYVLRLEAERVASEHRARGFAAMTAAAEVGAAPAVRYADPASGVAVMDFVAGRPLAEHPGGPPGLARDLGALTARLREAQPYPRWGDFPDVIAGLLAIVAASSLFAPGELAGLTEGMAWICAELPWDAARAKPSHNDPNPRNILFDGARLWLIDWELAFANDPLADLAIVTLETCAAPELQDALLAAALGRAADEALRARLAVMRLLARLFYGAVSLEVFAHAPAPASALLDDAPTPAAFLSAARSGQLTGEAIARAFGAMSLRAFRDGLAAPELATTLQRAAEG